MAKQTKITILPYSEESSDVSAYNSHAHRYEVEVVSALALSEAERDLIQFTHAEPPAKPYSYAHYAGLIAKSQGISTDRYLNLFLPSYLTEDVLLLQSAWISRSKLSEERIKDIAEAWTSAKECREIVDAAFGVQRTAAVWFVRLTDASPKDSQTKMPVSSMQELVTPIATSMRARSSIEREQAASREVTVFLRPCDDQIAKGIEFRCFMPPKRVSGPDSQQVWPFIPAVS